MTESRRSTLVTNGMPAARAGGPGPRSLAPEEERELLARAGTGDEAALHRLIEAHLGYVVAIARRYRGWGAPMNDLLQEGLLGLLQAVRRFRPEKGARLSTYAVWWIRSAIQEHALRSVSIVRLGTSNATRTLALRLRQLAGDLTAEADREARLAELARRFGATASEVKRLAGRLAAPDVSLDAVTQPVVQAAAAGRALIDRLVSDLPSPEQVLTQTRELGHLRQRLAAALAELSERERFVIHARYLGEVRVTFNAIAAQLGVSKDRARQLEAAALKKLHALLAPLASPEAT